MINRKCFIIGIKGKKLRKQESIHNQNRNRKKKKAKSENLTELTLLFTEKALSLALFYTSHLLGN